MYSVCSFGKLRQRESNLRASQTLAFCLLENEISSAKADILYQIIKICNLYRLEIQTEGKHCPSVLLWAYTIHTCKLRIFVFIATGMSIYKIKNPSHSWRLVTEGLCLLSCPSFFSPYFFSFFLFYTSDPVRVDRKAPRVQPFAHTLVAGRSMVDGVNLASRH